MLALGGRDRDDPIGQPRQGLLAGRVRPALRQPSMGSWIERRAAHRRWRGRCGFSRAGRARGPSTSDHGSVVWPRPCHEPAHLQRRGVPRARCAPHRHGMEANVGGVGRPGTDRAAENRSRRAYCPHPTCPPTLMRVRSGNVIYPSNRRRRLALCAPTARGEARGCDSNLLAFRRVCRTKRRATAASSGASAMCPRSGP